MTTQYKRIRQAVKAATAEDQGSLRLRSSMAPAVHTLVDAIAGDDLRLDDLTVVRNTPHVLEVQGGVALAGLSCRATLEVHDGAPLDVRMRLEPRAKRVSLHDLQPAPTAPLGALVATFRTAVGAGPSVELKDVVIEVASATAAVQVSGTAVAKAPLTVVGRTVTVAPTVTLRSEQDSTPDGPERSLTLTLGTVLRMGGQQLAVEIDLTGDARIVRGTWTADTKADRIRLSKVLAGLGLPARPPMPEGLDPHLSSVVMLYDSATSSVQLSATSDAFGTVGVSARKPADGPWQRAVTLDLPADASLGDLPVVGRELAPVDVFTFQRLSLVVASHDMTIRLPDGSPRELERGTNLVGVLDLAADDDTGQPSATGQLAATTGAPTLDVRMSLGTANPELVASLGGAVDLGGGLALADPYVSLGLSREPRIGIGGALLVDAGSMHLRADAAVELSPRQILGRFSIAATTPDGAPADLLEPLGIRGVSLSQLGMSVALVFTPPSVAIGLQATFGLGNEPAGSSQLAIVAQVLPTAPIPTLTIMALHFRVERLTLGVLLDVFTDEPPPLPTELAEIQASDLLFLYGQNPTTLPDGTPVPQGFRFRGEVDLFGFGARADVAIDAATGARGRFEVKPVDLRVGDLPVLRLTRATTSADTSAGDASAGTIVLSAAGSPSDGSDTTGALSADPAWANGPFFAFSSRGPQFLHANAEIELFGFLRRTVVVEVGVEGMSFLTQVALGPALTTTLACSLSDGDRPSFRGLASIDIDLDVDVPIVIGDLDLGHLRLDAGLHAEISIDASPDAFRMRLDCGFSFEGLDYAFEIELDVPLTALTDLAVVVVDWIVDHAGELFGDLFAGFEAAWDDAGAAIKAIADDVEQELAALEAAAEETIGQIEAEAQKAVRAVDDAVADAGAAVDAAVAGAALLIDQAAVEVAEIGQDVVEFVEEVDAAIDVAFAEAERVVRAVAREVERLKAEVETFVRDLVAEVEATVKELIDDAAAVAARVWHETAQFIDGLRATAAAMVDQLEREAKRFAAEAAAVWREVEQFLEEAAAEAERLAVAAGEGVIEGANIVGGAVEDAGNAVVDWVGGWF